MIGDRIDANLEIEADDFGYAPFDERWGLGRVDQLFGTEMPEGIEALYKELAA
jgi:type I restriction enzyme, R subunit